MSRPLKTSSKQVVVARFGYFEEYGMRIVLASDTLSSRQLVNTTCMIIQCLMTVTICIPEPQDLRFGCRHQSGARGRSYLYKEEKLSRRN
jgi:hypothetical protein